MTHFLPLNTKRGILKNGQAFYHLIYCVDCYAVFFPLHYFFGKNSANIFFFFYIEESKLWIWNDMSVSKLNFCVKYVRVGEYA